MLCRMTDQTLSTRRSTVADATLAQCNDCQQLDRGTRGRSVPVRAAQLHDAVLYRPQLLRGAHLPRNERVGHRHSCLGAHPVECVGAALPLCLTPHALRGLVGLTRVLVAAGSLQITGSGRSVAPHAATVPSSTPAPTCATRQTRCRRLTPATATSHGRRVRAGGVRAWNDPLQAHTACNAAPAQSCAAPCSRRSPSTGR